MADKYKIVINCWNCGEKVTIEVEKGHLVLEARGVNKCENCGCNLDATPAT